MLLDHIDHLSAAVGRLDAQVEAEVAPFTRAVELLGTIPGVGPRTAWVLLAEAGPDMTRFPSLAHLASWAGLCPGHHESAGKRPLRARPQGRHRAAHRDGGGRLGRDPHPQHLP